MFRQLVRRLPTARQSLSRGLSNYKSMAPRASIPTTYNPLVLERSFAVRITREDRLPPPPEKVPVLEHPTFWHPIDPHWKGMSNEDITGALRFWAKNFPKVHAYKPQKHTLLNKLIERQDVPKEWTQPIATIHRHFARFTNNQQCDRRSEHLLRHMATHQQFRQGVKILSEPIKNGITPTKNGYRYLMGAMLKDQEKNADLMITLVTKMHETKVAREIVNVQQTGIYNPLTILLELGRVDLAIDQLEYALKLVGSKYILPATSRASGLASAVVHSEDDAVKERLPVVADALQRVIARDEGVTLGNRISLVEAQVALGNLDAAVSVVEGCKAQHFENVGTRAEETSSNALSTLAEALVAGGESGLVDRLTQALAQDLWTSNSALGAADAHTVLTTPVAEEPVEEEAAAEEAEGDAETAQGEAEDKQ